MALIYTYQKSKKKNKTKKELSEYKQWLDNINSQTTNFCKKKLIVKKTNSIPALTVPVGRETKHYPSLNSGHHDTSKKVTMYYTGDKMKGIGTLHKSNAVPIFSDEEARDQANMRR